MRAASLVNRALLTLMAGHFTVDLLGGVLTVTYPLLRDRFSLDLAAIGLVATLFTASFSLSQPLFGYVIDRFDTRYLAGAAVAWMALFVALLGLAPSYPVLLILAVLAGLGSGAYHPQGATGAIAVTGGRRANTVISLYTIGGTSGYSLGPLIGAALLALFGLNGPAAILPFALAVALWLTIELGWRGQLRRPQAATTDVRRAGGVEERAPIRWKTLLAVLGVVMLRSWTFLVLVTFIPFLYRGYGYDSRFYSPLLFAVIIAGSAGTFCGGLVADRVGRLPVIVGSLLLLGPAIWLFLRFPGPAAFPLGILMGFIGDSSLSATFTLAQDQIPGRVGMISGIILGIGFVTGGVGVSLTGALADRVGLLTALALLPLLLLLALVLTLFLPRGERVRARGVGGAPDHPPRDETVRDDAAAPALAGGDGGR
jgi:FSR family fosmidomycin resistance protein-like MFS transporter